MLTVLNEEPSHKGHKMAKTVCSFCESKVVARLTSLDRIKSCGCASNELKMKCYIGDVFTNTKGSKAVVTYMESAKKIYVKFLDGTEHLDFFSLGHLRDGMFKNYMLPHVHGVGYFGAKHEYFKAKNRYHKQIQGVWGKMLSRCYNSTADSYTLYGAQGVYVDKEWHNFQNFLSWCTERNWKPGSQIDKDYLSNTQHKVYSKNTCILVPSEINTAISFKENLKFCEQTGENRFRVRISSGGTKVYIGTFNNKNEAILAYLHEKEGVVRKLALKYKTELSSDAFYAVNSWKIPEYIILKVMEQNL